MTFFRPRTAGRRLPLVAGVLNPAWETATAAVVALAVAGSCVVR